jgi:hypothetical protein
VIVPFLGREVEGDGAVELRVRAVSPGAAEVTVSIARENGQIARRGSLGRVGGTAVSTAGALGDLFAIGERGAAHVASADDDVALEVELVVGGVTLGSFGGADSLAGTDFRLAATDAAEPHAMLANGGDTHLFVFVDDLQGPMIPPGGAARVRVSVAGGPLHVVVEGGDAVLSYRGAPVPPSS